MHLYRKNSTTKLVCYLSILQKVEDIKDTLILLLSVNDVSVQQLVLKQVLKLNIPQLKRYEKSLLVFSSDTEFKDEITKFSLGEEKMKTEDRHVIIPYIIRILNAKLLKKRGKAAAKPLEAKRTLVYRFLASLSTQELDIFIAQVIEPFNLTIEDTKDQAILESKLSHCSFGQYLGYISALEGIVKQMGALVKDYLPIFCNILTAIFKLSKLFYKEYKNADQDPDEIAEEAEEEQPEEEKVVEEMDDSKYIDPLKKNTLKSCASTITGVYKRVNEIYEKYFFHQFVQNEFSTDVLKLYEDNISKMHTQNITAKSALLVTFETWSRHLDLHGLFLRSKVLDQLCRIVSTEKDIVHHEVYTLIFTIFKNIILASTDAEDIDKRDTIIRMFMENKEGEEVNEASNFQSVELVNLKYGTMISSIADMLSHNWSIIKNGVLNKKPEDNKNMDRVDKAVSQNILTKSQVFRSPSFVKTIIFVLSELSVYVNIDQKDNLEKLTDMFIPLLTVKGFVISGKEELVNYTLKTIHRLCEKMPSLITKSRYYQISKLLSERIKLSTRECLCNLLMIIPKESVKESIKYVKNMNKIKRGFATPMIDLDKAILSCNKFQEEKLQKCTYEESVAVLFQMLHFMAHPELALRAAATSVLDDFLQRYYNDILDYADADMKPDSKDLNECSIFINYHFLPAIRTVINTESEELLLKSCFKIFRKYLICCRDLNLNEKVSLIANEVSIPKDYVDMS